MLIKKKVMDKYYKSKVFFVDPTGLRQGDYTEYYSNGQVACQASYKNDKLSGICKRFYQSGKLLSECLYRNDKIVGTYTEYYEDGKPHVKCFYKAGLKDGLYEEFSKDGQLMEKKIYKNGNELSGQAAIEYLNKWMAERAQKAPLKRPSVER